MVKDAADEFVGLLEWSETAGAEGGVESIVKLEETVDAELPATSVAAILRTAEVVLSVGTAHE
jgi:hypothetical protein